MAKTKNKEEEQSKILQDEVFSKEQIIKSKKYSNRRDLLSAILEDRKSYSLKEIDKCIKEFMKGKVE